MKQEKVSVSTDGHGTALEVEHYHFNVLDIMQCAAKKFEEHVGRPARFFYAPEPFLYLVDLAVRQKAANDGHPVGEGIVRNVFGMELAIAPGTCFTITAEDAVRSQQARRALEQFDITDMKAS